MAQSVLTRGSGWRSRCIREYHRRPSVIGWGNHRQPGYLFSSRRPRRARTNRTPMKDPRINFRTRELAAVLAFLVPGAGHYYQGRRVKAGIFFSCIVSLFFAGMVLGDWQPVYSQTAYSPDRTMVEMLPEEKMPATKFSIGYGAQVFNGLSALPALLQQARFSAGGGHSKVLTEDIDSDFIGVLRNNERAVPVAGRITLSADGESGTIAAVAQDGLRFEMPFRFMSVRLGRKVYGSPRRAIILSQVSGIELEGFLPTYVEGSIERSFVDWYQAPRDNGELDRLHVRLSHQFDIACVFTWIAGLLNLMAIWDAYDGPAYGYGDESPEDEDDSSDEKSDE